MRLLSQNSNNAAYRQSFHYRRQSVGYAAWYFSYLLPLLGEGMLLMLKRQKRRVSQKLL